MTSNRVICQCWRIRCLSYNLTIRNQSQFDQCLDPLQIPSASPSLSFNSFSTASLIFAFWNAVAKNFAEPSGSSPALNPPREHDHLCLSDCLFKLGNRITDILCIHITEYLCDHICACSLKRLTAVILTVCSRKYRNKYGRLSDLMTADMNIRCMIELFFHHFIIICGRFCRKYTFQSACPCFFRFCQSNFGTPHKQISALREPHRSPCMQCSVLPLCLPELLQ